MLSEARFKNIMLNHGFGPDSQDLTYFPSKEKRIWDAWEEKASNFYKEIILELEKKEPPSK